MWDVLGGVNVAWLSGICANNRLRPIVRTICQVDVSSMWQHCFCCWWFGIAVGESLVSGFVIDRVAFILTGIFHDHYRELVALIFISGNPGSETGCNALFLCFPPNSDKYPGSTGNVFLFGGGGGEGDSPGSQFYMPTFRNTLFRLYRRCK